MRILVLSCLALSACAIHPPPKPVESKTAQYKTRNCPPLPILKEGARRSDLLAHIAKQAEMYAKCATGEP